MESNPTRPPHNPASAPVMPPGPSALENHPVSPPPPPAEEAHHPFPIPAGNTPHEPEEPKKHFWKSKLFLIVLLLLVIFIPVSIFAVSKLTSKPAPSPSPAATPTPSPSPIDETAGWNIYTSSSYNWQIKYSPEVNVTTYGKEDIGKADLEIVEFSTIDKSKGLGKSEGFVFDVGIMQKTEAQSLQEFAENDSNLKTVQSKTLLASTQINGLSGFETLQTITSGLSFKDIYLQHPSSQSLVIYFSMYANGNKYEEILAQMLSTFKLTDSSTEVLNPSSKPSDTPVEGGGKTYCIQDVKICPDGSYVSRQGPNCEFSPCPNLSQ